MYSSGIYRTQCRRGEFLGRTSTESGHTRTARSLEPTAGDGSHGGFNTRVHTGSPIQGTLCLCVSVQERKYKMQTWEIKWVKLINAYKCNILQKYYIAFKTLTLQCRSSNNNTRKEWKAFLVLSCLYPVIILSSCYFSTAILSAAGSCCQASQPCWLP